MDARKRTGILVVVVAVLAVVALAWMAIDAVGQAPAPAPSRPQSRAEFQRYLMAEAVIEDGAPVLAFDAADPGPTLYDRTGQVRDPAWLLATFGIVGWERAEAHADADFIYRLTELRESCGPAVIIVNVKDENGAPLAGRAVVRYWPSAPALPYYDPPASRWTDLGVVGWTSGAGDVGFGLGAGDYYFPETGSGVTQIYIADYDGPSDLVKNLGMLGGTEHCTLFPVYHRIPAEVDPPTPTPGPTDTPGPTGTPAPVPEGLIKIEELWIKVATPAP